MEIRVLRVGSELGLGPKPRSELDLGSEPELGLRPKPKSGLDLGPEP